MNDKLKVILFGKEQKINWRSPDIYIRLGFVSGILVLMWATLRNMGIFLAIWKQFENILPTSVYVPMEIQLRNKPGCIIFLIAGSYTALLIILSYCQVIKMRDFTRVLFYFLLFLLFVEFGITCF